MASDAKKTQTCLNRFAEEMIKARAASAVIQQIKAAVVAHDLVDDFPPGSVGPLNTLATEFQTLVDSAVVDALIAHYVPSHRSQALPGEVD